MSRIKIDKKPTKKSSESSRRVKQVRAKGVSMLLTPELLAELIDDNRSDSEIDFSDIPEVTSFDGAVRGKYYRAMKEPISLRIDADVLAWLRIQPEPYQTRINAVLREYMEQRIAKLRKT